MRADWKNENWSKYLYDNIPASMLKAKLSDGDLYYKGYNELNDAHKREFFVMLFSSLARFESGFKPETTYKEGFNDSKGKPVISRGLFQVSVESLGGYKFKTTASELHDPLINIRAMLTVASRWLVKDECIAGGKTDEWLGLARYWSVFRKPHRIAAIRKNTNALTFNKEIPMDIYEKFYAAAKSQMGESEIPGISQNKKIIEYHSYTSLKAKDESVPWCSSFINFVVAQCGLKGTNSAAAKSWMTWGKPLKAPVKGCIVVLTRKGGNHVALFDHKDGDKLFLLGGNQGDSVCLAAYPASRLLGYRGV